MEDEKFKERKKLLLDLIYDKAYVPMKAKEIAMLLSIPKSQRGELEEVLSALTAEGKIGISKRGKYGRPETFSLTGIFSGNARGFGFVTVEGQEQDVFIPEEKTGGALHGDKVQIFIEREAGAKGRAEGAVLRILEHANREVVGFYQKNKTFGFVIPDNQRINRDIFIPLERTRGAVTGQKVTAEITDYGRGRKSPEGRITQILGEASDPETEVLSLILAYGLPTDFPERVENQAKRVAKPVSEADREGRLDLRGEVCVTIDGEDAKDLDDAVSLRRESEHYLLGVHIADVANYVQENSALDWEARERGTSVYLADRVIPMLPRTLSNGICSLNQGEDRLALSCIMTIDEKGKIVGHRLAETVIRVNRRLSYTGVQKVLDGDETERSAYPELVPMLLEME